MILHHIYIQHHMDIVLTLEVFVAESVQVPYFFQQAEERAVHSVSYQCPGFHVIWLGMIPVYVAQLMNSVIDSTKKEISHSLALE